MRAVSAIIRATDTGRIVLVKRRDPPRQGEWSLPGGSVEQDESEEAALARELREELGLEVDAARIGPERARAIVPSPRGDFSISVRVYEVAREPPLDAASDAVAIMWALPRELRAIGVREDTVAIVERALRALP